MADCYAIACALAVAKCHNGCGSKLIAYAHNKTATCTTCISLRSAMKQLRSLLGTEQIIGLIF